jgi:hypothetical protein
MHIHMHIHCIKLFLLISKWNQNAHYIRIYCVCLFKKNKGMIVLFKNEFCEIKINRDGRIERFDLILGTSMIIPPHNPHQKSVA